MAGQSERLQKYMAECGIASRRVCEKLILEGRVLVNGVQAELGMSVCSGEDKVLFDGKPVRKNEKRRVIAFYKPRGVVCTSNDPEGRRTVQDYFINVPERLYNVGRLDLNSEGLLLMTNDGELANKMTHPKYEVEKTYYAVCDGTLTFEQKELLINGVLLDDGMTAPARIDTVKTNEKGDTSFLITIHEGRNRQIRRMLEAVGHKTLRLKREKFGPISIDKLRSGEWRDLTAAEIEALKRI